MMYTGNSEVFTLLCANFAFGSEVTQPWCLPPLAAPCSSLIYTRETLYLCICTGVCITFRERDTERGGDYTPGNKSKIPKRLLQKEPRSRKQSQDSQNPHGITEWFGWEGTSKLISFLPTSHGSLLLIHNHKWVFWWFF